MCSGSTGREKGQWLWPCGAALTQCSPTLDVGELLVAVPAIASILVSGLLLDIEVVCAYLSTTVPMRQGGLLNPVAEVQRGRRVLFPTST